MRRIAVVCVTLIALAMLACSPKRDNDNNPPPTPHTNVTSDFITYLRKHRGYPDAEVIAADPSRAAVYVVGCWIELRQIDGSQDYTVERSINGPPPGEAVERALDELGNSPTKSELETTIRRLTEQDHLAPCKPGPSVAP